MLKRLHHDVEEYFGIDSMVAPLSALAEQQEMKLAEWEIEVFTLFTAAEEIAEIGYFDGSMVGALEWLIGLRHGKRFPQAARARLHTYQSRDHSGRRLLFGSVIEQELPEATKAPLVIYRLYPRAVKLTTALALDNRDRAAEMRDQQLKLLPAISDCSACHGGILEVDEICAHCGNPLWTIRWLSEAD